MIKNKNKKNFFWILLSRIFKILCQIYVLFFIIKNINVENYGNFGIVLILVTFFYLFKDIGTGANLVQTKKIDKILIKNTFTFHVTLSLLVTFFYYVAGKLINEYYLNSKVFLDLLIIFLPIFFINSISIVKMRLLERESNFKTISIIEIFSNIFSLIIMYISFIKGYGVKCLAINLLSYSIISSILFLIYERTDINFNLYNFNKIKLNFYSKNIFLFNISEYFRDNIDRIMVSAIFGQYIFGLYNLSNRITIPISQNFSEIIARFTFPLYSRMQNKLGKIYQHFNSSIQINNFILSPILFFIIINSQILTKIIFQNEWIYVSNLLPFLCLIALVQSNIALFYSFYKSQKNNLILKKFGYVEVVIIFFSILIGSKFNIVGVCIMFLIIKVIFFGFLSFKTLKLFNVEKFKFYFELSLIILFSLISSFISKYFILNILENFQINYFLLLKIFIINFALYSLLIYFFLRKKLNKYLSIF